MRWLEEKTEAWLGKGNKRAENRHGVLRACSLALALTWGPTHADHNLTPTVRLSIHTYLHTYLHRVYALTDMRPNRQIAACLRNEISAALFPNWETQTREDAHWLRGGIAETGYSLTNHSAACMTACSVCL